MPIPLNRSLTCSTICTASSAKTFLRSSFRWFWPTEAQSFPILKWLSASRIVGYEERTYFTVIRLHRTKRALLKWITSLCAGSCQKERPLTDSHKRTLTIWWTTSIPTAELNWATERPMRLLLSTTVVKHLKSLSILKSIQVVSWWHRSCLRDNE